MFEQVTIAKQLAAMSGWKDPIVWNVVSTIIYRQPASASNLLDYEFLVTKRLKGAAKGHLQTHHGGYLKPTDIDVMAGALRELREETGFVIPRDVMQLAAIIGPKLYRSTLELEGEHTLSLTITEQAAEPNAPFSLPLFVANVDGYKRNEQTDGEVGEMHWLTLRQIIAQYGQSPIFNYFNILMASLRTILGEKPDFFPPSSPGIYHLEF